MSCCDFSELQKKLLILHEQLSIITKPPSLPFSAYNKEYVQLLEFLDRLILDSGARAHKQSMLCTEKMDEIRKMSADIGITCTFSCSEKNLSIRLDMLDTEATRLESRLQCMKHDVEQMESRAVCLCEELGMQVQRVGAWKSETLAEKRDNLESWVKQLEERRRECERNKAQKIQEIHEFVRQLGDQEHGDALQAILRGECARLPDVERVYGEIKDVFCRRSMRVKSLRAEIARVKRLLHSASTEEDRERTADAENNDNTQDLNAEDVYSQERIATLETVLESLREKRQQMFKSIFACKLNELTQISRIFKVHMEKYEETEKDLEKIEQIIEEMLPKKEMFLEILSLIDKRDNLLVAMIEFEKIASDPRRLFKSSFQLLSEERFRKNAAPTLFRTERELLERILEYECQFGPFYLNGNYKEQLTEEIKNRIINKNVFIVGGLDSPRKRRK